MADLFPDELPDDATEASVADAPLADRLRPKSLAEIIGQEHLTGPEGAIGRMVAAGKLSSLGLWGPPGTGKTSIARLLADAVGIRFAAISAVFSGVADLKKQIGERTVSRLMEMCGDALPLYGSDRRVEFDPAKPAAGV